VIAAVCEQTARKETSMSRDLLVRSSAALIALAVTLMAERPVGAAFSDFLVQPPRLAPPERGSVSGAFAHLAFEPGSLARGDLSLPVPIALPGERGGPLAGMLPSYSPGGAQSEWGMGWQVDLSIRRFAIVGDIDLNGDEFVSSWGRLARGDDGRYLPLGAPPHVSLRRVDGGWAATTSDGTTYTFAAADAVAGGYAWMLSRVDDVLGGATVLSYVRNASGRPFVSAVEWGGQGSQRQYRMELGYETIAVPIDDYRSGTRLSLDQRVHSVTVKALGPGGTFATRWSYRLDYTASPAGAAFYLTGVTRTFGSGTAEPTQRFEYDFGDSTIASATLVEVPALNPALLSLGGTALQPDKAGALDLEDDGLIDFEVAKDQTLLHQQAGGFSMEALPSSPGVIALCRPPVSSANLPRALARMTPDAPVQVFRTINNVGLGTTRLLVCDRQGVPLTDQSISGTWALGPTVHLVDLNHDHRPDLVRIFSRGYQVVENTSDATGYHFVVHATGTLTDTFTPDSSWVQDMNGDGQPDLVMRLSSAIAVWYGLGQFHFAQTAHTFVLKSAAGITITDLAQRQLTFLDVNRDGLMDVITTQGRVLNLFVNDGHQLNEVVVPGLRTMSWDFGVPVVADVTGSGEHEVLFVQGAQARSIRLTAPSTGLLIAAHDGKGTDVHFAYRRSAPVAGFGRRMALLDTLTMASSGYDPVTFSYGYGAPVIHSLGKYLVGFASVDKHAPVVTQHVEFLNDDDVSGVHALSETMDDRSPGIVRFARDQYDDVAFDGVRWLRPALSEAGHRSRDASTILSTTTQYTVYERGFCPTVVTTTSPSGSLTTMTTLASVAAIPDEAHCLPASQMLVGTHADPSRDFTYLADMDRNDAGQVTRVTQIDPRGAALVLQDVAYTTDHRVASVGAPGRGTTTMTYDDLGRLATVTDPTGVITSVNELDPLSDALRQLQTVRPGAPATMFFAYDARERLQASWDDISGGSELQPLASYAYQDATANKPARIDSTTLADAITSTARQSVALLAADGESLVAGTWLGDHVALGTAAITSRTSLTDRHSFIGTMTDAALSALSSADLRAAGTPLFEAVNAGFGYPVQTITTYQDGVTGTDTTELVLSGSELITRLHQPGGFTAESAVDAAGKLARKTDENGIPYRYNYDALGRLVHVDTPDGGHTLAFDGFGRPAQVRRDGIGAITYRYDPVTGLVVRKQRLDATGAVVDTSDTQYDAIGRPIGVAQTAGPDGSSVALDYDGQLDGTTVGGQLGRLTRVRGDGWARSALFDPLGRSYEQHITLTGWRDLTRDLVFRADGSVESDTLSIRDGAGAVLLTSTQDIVLDGLGRPKTLEVDGAALYTLTYDDEGRLARADFTSGEAITFDYDPVTHARRGDAVQAPGVTGGVDWERDPRGLIKAEVYTNGTATTRRTYGYDGRGQLTSATAGGDNATYSYTASGLPDTIEDTLGARSVHHSSDTLTVGDVTYTWDAAGRVCGKGAWSFGYGPSGQLTHASRPGRDVDFVYDEADQRILKRVDGVPVRASVAGGVLTEDHFVELVVIGGVVAGVLDNGRFTALLTDPRGTPFAGPDGTPGLATPYGARASHLGYAEVIDYTRLGWDADLDVVRMGVRDYDPLLAQFLTPDPLYFENLDKCAGSPLQCALYGYAGGDPIRFIDPTGFGWRDWLDTVADRVSNAAVAVSDFTVQHVVPRAIGAGKAIGGAVVVVAAAGFCEGTFGAGCALSAPVATSALDVGISGAREAVFGKPAPTLVGQALGPVAQQFEEGVVGGAALAEGLGTFLAARAASRILAPAARPGVGAAAAGEETAAVERVVAAGGGSIKQVISAANQVGLNQSQAVQAITRAVEVSGRSVGGVVDVVGGAKVLTGVVPGAGKPIVHIAATGIATFGSASVDFTVDSAGNLVTRVTNIVLP
jgi:RHS repeat-associated protein